MYTNSSCIAFMNWKKNENKWNENNNKKIIITIIILLLITRLIQWICYNDAEFPIRLWWTFVECTIDISTLAINYYYYIGYLSFNTIYAHNTIIFVVTNWQWSFLWLCILYFVIVMRAWKEKNKTNAESLLDYRGCECIFGVFYEFFVTLFSDCWEASAILVRSEK